VILKVQFQTRSQRWVMRARIS